MVMTTCAADSRPTGQKIRILVTGKPGRGYISRTPAVPAPAAPGAHASLFAPAC